MLSCAFTTLTSESLGFLPQYFGLGTSLRETFGVNCWTWNGPLTTGLVLICDSAAVLMIGTSVKSVGSMLEAVPSVMATVELLGALTFLTFGKNDA